MVQIYHNPRCSKSRQTLDILKQKGISPDIILYLDEVPTKEELTSVIKKLNIPSQDLLRKNEDCYTEFLEERGLPSYDDAIDWMIECPKLIERPIVINGDNAKVGRPPESVLDIL